MIWIAWGWRSLLLFLVGSAIAATGILEWRQLMSAVHHTPGSREREPLRAHPKPLGGVLFWFFIRLCPRCRRALC